MHITLDIFPILPNDKANLQVLIDSLGNFIGYNRLKFAESWRIFGQIIDLSKYAYKDESWPTPVVAPIPLPKNTSLLMYEDEGLVEVETNDLD
ncbi:MAG: hypothetical protein RLZZ517_319 [Candidatus Parcubacteria bacterium]|jgi:hypothetical protein